MVITMTRCVDKQTILWAKQIENIEEAPSELEMSIRRTRRAYRALDTRLIGGCQVEDAPRTGTTALQVGEFFKEKEWKRSCSYLDVNFVALIYSRDSGWSALGSLKALPRPASARRVSISSSSYLATAGNF